MYGNINLDKSFPTFHKFPLNEGAQAKQIDDSFPMSTSDDSYGASNVCIESKVGAWKPIDWCLFRELLSMIIGNKKSKLSVIDVYDQLKCHFRFL